MLIEIWDYFMRRKKLLLAVIAIFVISGCTVAQVLQQVKPKIPEREITYIEIREWGTPEEVEIPHTGGSLPNVDAMTELGVISPADVASLPALSVEIKNDYMEPISDAELDRIIEDIVADGFDIRENNTAEETVQDALPSPESEVTYEKHDITFWELLGEVILLLLGVSVMLLLGYLTYQHFMR